MSDPAPDSRDSPRGAADTPTVPDSGAEGAPKPITPLHLTVLVLFVTFQVFQYRRWKV